MREHAPMALMTRTESSLGVEPFGAKSNSVEVLSAFGLLSFWSQFAVRCSPVLPCGRSSGALCSLAISLSFSLTSDNKIRQILGRGVRFVHLTRLRLHHVEL